MCDPSRPLFATTKQSPESSKGECLPLPLQRHNIHISFEMKEQHTRHTRALRLWFLVVVVLTPVVVGFPYTILSSSSQKCVFLDVSNELVVTIEYHAPGKALRNRMDLVSRLGEWVSH